MITSEEIVKSVFALLMCKYSLEFALYDFSNSPYFIYK